jgi:N-acyl-L-homoserine lactone synthetase
MQIGCYPHGELNQATWQAVMRYRHAVFVQTLGWQLPSSSSGMDADQFDAQGAVHLVATDGAGEIVGYARLLPTTGPYLLGNLFPHLIAAGEPPHTRTVWELSRYTAVDLRHGRAANGLGNALVGKRLLRHAIQYTAAQGADSLVFCSTVAIERLSHRWGIDTRRLGCPLRSGDDLLIAALIEFTDRTCAALDEERLQTVPLAHSRADVVPVVHLSPRAFAQVA